MISTSIGNKGAWGAIPSWRATMARKPSYAELEKRVLELEQRIDSYQSAAIKYRALFSTFPHGIAVTDGQGNVIETNASAAKLLGISKQEHEKRSIDSPQWVIIHPDGAFMPVHERAAVVALREHRVVADCEMGIVKPEGRITWINVTAAPVPIDNHGVVVTFSDITARRQAEEAHRQEEKRYRRLFESHIDAVYLISNEGDILDANESACLSLARSKENITSLSIKDIDPNYDAETFKMFWSGQEEERIHLFESTHMRADGTVFPVEVIGIPFMDNGKRLLYGFARDITERKHTEENLRKSQERLDLALKATQDAVWDWDLAADSIYYSPVWWNMLGYAENELEADAGMWRRLMHPEDLESIGRIVGEAIEQSTAFEVKSRLRHKEGHYVPVLTRGFILRDAEARAIRISGIITDLTEREQLESEHRRLEQQQQQLQKMESLNRMAGAIAHRFNNLLATAIGNLELVMEELPSRGADAANLTEALQATRHAANVCGMLLTYLGQTSGRQEPLNLSHACRKNLSIFKTRTPKTLVLQSDLPLSGLTIKANAAELTKVILNLCTNAAEAIGEKSGTIHVALKTVSASEIPTTHRFPIDWQLQGDRFACLEVRDTGCGMTAKQIDHIFDPFFSHKFVGRGLGLPVVLGIMRAHGGGVAVQSDPECGSIFRVYFPLAAEVSAIPTRSKEPAVSFSGGTVLLVEDEERVRLTVEKMLNRVGFDVISAKDGVEALRVFQQHRDDILLVLCDLNMPHMNGWETMSALRKLSPGLSIILCSGHDETKVMQGEYPEQPQAFLQKPYGLKDLREILGETLNLQVH
jgi:PAS domain S-box-containing protein